MYSQIKAIIIDLDGVLWEGSCHSGLSTIIPNTELISVLSSLVKKGVILGSLSANHSHIAEGTLSALGLLDLFADWRFEFISKEKGMRSILKDFNLLPQNVLYIDDTEYERELVHTYFHDMLVLDIGPGQDFLKNLDNGLPNSMTKEGFSRTLFYRNARKRRYAEDLFQGPPAEFLRALKTVVKIVWNVKEIQNMLRVEEMFCRNHQFNTSNTVYNVSQLQNMIRLDRVEIIMVEASDCYGSYGICGCIIIEHLPKNNILTVTDLTFSCRVQRPHIIGSALRYVLSKKRDQGYTSVRINFLQTEHNFHLACLFESIGLIKESTNGTSFSAYVGNMETLKITVPDFVSVFDALEHTDQYPSRIPFVYSIVESFVSSHKPAGVFLDIGTGAMDVLGQEWYKHFDKRFPACKLITLDNDPLQLTSVIADAQHLTNFESESVNTILCLETLEHMQGFWNAVDEFLRILELDGYLIVSAPMNFEIHGGANDFFRFTPRGLVTLFENANNEKACFVIQKVFIEGDVIFPTRTVLIASKINKGGMA